MNYLNPNRFGVSQLGSREANELSKVIKDGQLFRFREDEEASQNDFLEAELAHYLETRHVVTVANGTAGLRAALTAIGINKGDVVAVSAYTFIATAHAVLSFGAWPVPLDMTENLSINCEDLSKKLQYIKAVIPVYAPGHSSNIADVTALATAAGIPVVEDACQAFGVRSYGAYAGTIGTMGVFSFQQNKQLASGEGGAVVGFGDDVMGQVRRFADHGAVRLSNGIPTWDHDDALIGDNLRMTELQAAILRPQLRDLGHMIHLQREARNEISRIISDWPTSIVQSVDPQGDTGAYLILLASNSESVADWISLAAEHNVLLKRFWPCLFYEHGTIQKAYQQAQLPEEPVCRHAESLSRRLLALPIPPILHGENLNTFITRLIQVRSSLRTRSRTLE